MKAYYEEAGIIIYHGDCREILPKVDLVLTDPPYGLDWNKGNLVQFGKTSRWHGGTDMKWDSRPSPETLALVVASARQFVVWGGNYFAKDLGDCKGVLIWDKKTGANSFADAELAWSNVVGTSRIFRHQWCGAFKDSERGMKSEHPTQKPEALFMWCISLADNPKSICDPFSGSGTTLVAAKKSAVSAIGIEREERYCEIAANRLRQGVLWSAQ